MRELQPYQHEGIAFALERKRCLIADEMGLGKTVQAIGVINANPRIRTVLIVCPASLRLNWWRELDMWLERKGDVSTSIISYEALAKLGAPRTDLVIIDEAHYVKNQKSIRLGHLKRVLINANQAIFLTGTPVDNRPLELWPLLQLLDAETWDPAGRIKGKRVGVGEGAGFFPFALRYCGAYKQVMGKKSFWNFSGGSNLEELHERLKPLMIRRKKDDVLTFLPPKRHHIITLPSSVDEGDWLKEFTEDNYEERIRELKAEKAKFEEFTQKRLESGMRKAPMVVEHVLRVLEERPKVILFTQHKMVYDALKGRMGGTLHALALQTSIPGA